MPGTLFVVATPIGNLEDITLRALRVLRDVDVIAAEDTRRTARLLARHAISTRTLSFHEHNTRSRIPQLLSRLAAGQSIALVTDAGTPGISDPGVELVDACVSAGIPIDPIPGVSAAITAAVASGFPLVPLTIWGFPPARSKDRNTWLLTCSEIPTTMTFFEAPHRIVETLRAGAGIWGNRPIMVGRELTKVHQEFLRGTASDVLPRLEASAKGEFTIVVGPMTKKTVSEVIGDAKVAEEFNRQTRAGATSRRAALSATAKRLGLSPKDVYAAVERTKDLGDTTK
jgi:16S rRNA (cytidine1402-2'-O)-methyltransferase